jgi:hypothetical protein
LPDAELLQREGIGIVVNIHVDAQI